MFVIGNAKTILLEIFIDMFFINENTPNALNQLS